MITKYVWNDKKWFSTGLSFEIIHTLTQSDSPHYDTNTSRAFRSRLTSIGGALADVTAPGNCRPFLSLLLFSSTTVLNLRPTNLRPTSNSPHFTLLIRPTHQPRPGLSPVQPPPHQNSSLTPIHDDLSPFTTPTISQSGSYSSLMANSTSLRSLPTPLVCFRPSPSHHLVFRQKSLSSFSHLQAKIITHSIYRVSWLLPTLSTPAAVVDQAPPSETTWDSWKIITIIIKSEKNLVKIEIG
ncbi:hypothetical protein CROQUDRAFT_90435 [Cronartium quercuum f. sp. fusiforme G11]|uniref:Uncharacterized protein n=1 Tax=Cronartium quercuum f. sp. fusiforme G11 TaxID=708437 RepID=A0A9P6NRN0_9BASI|nr:hypothetical protein CROQUDRAFT_90435 [Cronartium quercuum f. sp. fusiforme G11]